MSNKKVDDESAQIANDTEAMNQLLLVVRCPVNFRSFINTLIGYADGRVNVSVFDAELGLRQSPGRSEEAAAKWVQRNRNGLNNWQQENNIYLIEGKGGFINRNNNPVPSRYYIHLTNYVKSILEEAKKDQKRWDAAPHAAIEFAARKVAKNVFTRPQVFMPTQPKAKDVGKDVSRRLASCITNIEAIGELMQKHSYNATKEQSDQWAELKGLISYYNYEFEDEDEDEDYFDDEEEDEEGSAINYQPFDTE